MSAARQLTLLSPEEYLTAELRSPVKHEYVGGMVYAMAGARNEHNRIVTNALIALGSRLRGKPCQAFNSDTKVRVRLLTQTRFYYPDAMVVCRFNAPSETFQDEPVVLVEVLSESTRRIDEGEKKDAYLSIPSLSAYLMIEQDSVAIVVYRRTEQEFVRELYEGLKSVIALPEVEIELPLAEVYDSSQVATNEVRQP